MTTVSGPPSRRVPVLVLGGAANSLSIIRSLSKHGIAVHLAADPSCLALGSRFCASTHTMQGQQSQKQFYWDLLLARGTSPFDGSVLYPCSDEAIEFVATHHDELRKRFILDMHQPAQQLALLDKKQTLRLARNAECPAPQFWDVERVDDLDAIASQVQFPVTVKPLHSHLFQQVFHRKLLLVHDFDELRSKVKEALERGVQVMVCEMIPGPDTQLSSYYTHLDDDGVALFHFTKRVIRRSPMNFGGATYHVTEWLPETAQMGKRFFKGIGFRGLGNIEFKKDPRDGQLKVIECNARFTAAQELLVRSGIDIAYLIYLRLTGQKVPLVDHYEQGLHLWLPEADFDAFRELSRRGMLSLPQWLRTLAHPQVFAYFDITDPYPALSGLMNSVKSRVVSRFTHRSSPKPHNLEDVSPDARIDVRPATTIEGNVTLSHLESPAPQP